MKCPNIVWAVAALALALGGCSSKSGIKTDTGAGLGAPPPGGVGPKTSRYGQGNQGDMYDNGNGGGQGYGRGAYGDQGYGQGGQGYGAGGSGDPALDDPAGPLAKRVVYFRYDSYEVLPEYQSVVTSHANYLAAHPDRNAVLEGHADERGSSEYNVALGEQRAQAVARMLQLQGAANGQLQVVSFGEEKPATSGHDEPSWQQNRRVEISYPGR